MERLFFTKETFVFFNTYNKFFLYALLTLMKLEKLNYLLITTVSLLAVMVMFGWCFEIPVLVQVIPGQAPMQFNTAIAFLLLGIGSFCLLRRKNTAVVVCALVTLILSIATFSQYMFGWDLNVDNLIIDHSITDKTSHQGRMAPNTSICFTISSLILLFGVYLPKNRFKAFVLCILLATLFALSINTLIGYFFKLEHAQGWMQWTRMAIHTGAAFIILGGFFTLYLATFDKSIKKLRSVHISLIIVYASLLVTLTVGFAQKSGEYSFISETIDNRLESYELDVRRTMAERLRAFERFSGRWDSIIDEPKNAEIAAEQFLSDFPGLDAIAWVRNKNEIVDVYSLEFNESYQKIPEENEILSRIIQLDDDSSYVGLRTTVGWPQAVFAFTVDTPKQGRIGTLIFYWRASDVFKVEASDIQNDFNIAAMSVGLNIYSSSPQEDKFIESSYWVRNTTIDIDGMKIDIRFNPYLKAIENLNSKTSTLIFSVGLPFCLLLGFSTYYYSTSIKNAAIAIANKGEVERLALRLDIATSGAEIGIWELDYASNRVVWNDITAKHMSLENYELSSDLESWLGHLEETDRKQFKNKLNSILKNADSFKLVLKYHLSPYSIRYLQFTASATVELANTVIGTVSDISEDIERLEHERALTSELKRSNEELEDFARIASHDLQEPLRKIRAFGERLSARSEQLDSKSLDYIERMQSAAARMSRLVEDLLEYSRVSRRGHSFQNVSLNKVLEISKDNLETAITESGAKIVSVDLPTINGDEGQLTQLFQNLLANAIKYTDERTKPVIRITCGLLSDPSSDKMYELCFEDNGIGFNQEYANKVFEVFQRLHGISEYSGTGVGLSICKKIVERHQGSIRAVSIEGKGSKFYVSLPEDLV